MTHLISRLTPLLFRAEAASVMWFHLGKNPFLFPDNVVCVCRFLLAFRGIGYFLLLSYYKQLFYLMM